jgi:hypothetical protein
MKVMTAKFDVMISTGENLKAATFDDAQKLGDALAKDGDIFGVEGRGKRGFYMKRGGVSYPISAKVAALEMAMKG